MLIYTQCSVSLPVSNLYAAVLILICKLLDSIDTQNVLIWSGLELRGPTAWCNNSARSSFSRGKICTARARSHSTTVLYRRITVFIARCYVHTGRGGYLCRNRSLEKADLHFSSDFLVGKSIRLNSIDVRCDFVSQDKDRSCRQYCQVLYGVVQFVDYSRPADRPAPYHDIASSTIPLSM